MNLKDEILDRLDEAGYPENEFALHYDEFFTDIEDQEVIGVNIPYNKPTTQEFTSLVKCLLISYVSWLRIYIRMKLMSDGCMVFRRIWKRVWRRRELSVYGGTKVSVSVECEVWAILL